SPFSLSPFLSLYPFLSLSLSLSLLLSLHPLLSLSLSLSLYPSLPSSRLMLPCSSSSRLKCYEFCSFSVVCVLLPSFHISPSTLPPSYSHAHLHTHTHTHTHTQKDTHHSLCF